MAPKTLSEKPVEEKIKKNLKVDPSKLGDNHLTPPKDRSPSYATSCISSSGDAACSFKDTDADQESLLSEQSFYYPANSYYGYYYPGYEASQGELVDDQGYYYSSDGLEIQYPAMQADNGSLIYYSPGYQPGYVPYSPYLPGATIGVDGQYMNQQSYYLSPMSPQPVASSGYYPTSLPYGSEVMPSYLWDPSLQAGDVIYGNSYAGVPSVPGYSSSFSVPSHTFAPSKSLPSSKPNNLETKGTLPALDDVATVNELKPVNKANTALSKGYFPMAKLPGSNSGKGGLLYPNNPVNLKANGRVWGGTDKLKTRSKGNGIGEFDLLNEQNRGPRTNTTKVASAYGVDTAGSPLAKGNDSSDNSATIIKRDQYNDPNFTSKYEHALFFVIKSYSEDDIHKSIKYNVWASTPNGNKRLDSAYQEAQEKMGERGSKCPVFLFFSVNASGQFCGVAEMMGRVDFNKNMDFWQQDKWNGFFPVKWHIIKDVPNPHFRHIILENNDNKPVTNSRDTQEVRFPQGTEMLNIFKNYSLKTSILDDFAFYESRQKAMQDKRIRAPMPRLGQLQQKLDEVVQLASDLQAIDLGAKKQQNEPMIGEVAKA